MRELQIIAFPFLASLQLGAIIFFSFLRLKTLKEIRANTLICTRPSTANGTTQTSDRHLFAKDDQANATPATWTKPITSEAIDEPISNGDSFINTTATTMMPRKV